jgi:type I restriction enzyme S subunit
MTPTEQNDVPELRFPDFKTIWSLGNFSLFNVQIIDGDRGVNYPKSTDFLPVGDCLFLSAKNVTKRGFSFEEVSFISHEKDSAMSKGKLEPGDIALTTRGSLGQIALFDESVQFDSIRINSGMVLLRCKSNNSSSFFYQQLKSDRFQREVERISFGSAQPQLTVGGTWIQV